jgi:hypothetical protein
MHEYSIRSSGVVDSSRACFLYGFECANRRINVLQVKSLLDVALYPVEIDHQPDVPNGARGWLRALGQDVRYSAKPTDR